MLKKLALITALVAGLTGCGHQQAWVGPAVVGGVIGYGMAQQSQPRVYVEQQVIHPINSNRYAQCEIYLRRYANCSGLRTTYDERTCQANERNYYNSCMTR
jgi:hypothetical protein